MMSGSYIYDRTAELVAWALDRTHGASYGENARAIGREVDGELVAVVVYDGFGPRACSVNVAALPGRQWMTREFAYRAFHYPFVQLDLPRIYTLVSVNNEASLRYSRHIGWVEEGRLREAGPDGEDYILFGMLRRECVFLNRERWRERVKARIRGDRCA